MRKSAWRTGAMMAVAAGAGLLVAGAVTLMAQETTPPVDRQTVALTQLLAPPSPVTFALADEGPVDAPPAASPCVDDLDTYVQPLAVTFAAGGSRVSPDHRPLLSHIARLIATCEGALVQVAGHADGSGDDRTNMALSWDRADETLHALVELGVDPAALEAVGYGARVPLAQGSGDDEAAANRRVDFRVLRRRD